MNIKLCFAKDNFFQLKEPMAWPIKKLICSYQHNLFFHNLWCQAHFCCHIVQSDHMIVPLGILCQFHKLLSILTTLRKFLYLSERKNIPL